MIFDHPLRERLGHDRPAIVDTQCLGDHLTIGEGARVAAGAGVLADIPAGETWSGYPARPIRQFLRETVWLAKQASSKKAPRES